MEPADAMAAEVGTGRGPNSESTTEGIGVVAWRAGARRRSRQAVPRPKLVQFSLTEEEFDEVSEAAERLAWRGVRSRPRRRWLRRGAARPGRARRCGRHWSS